MTRTSVALLIGLWCSIGPSRADDRPRLYADWARGSDLSGQTYDLDGQVILCPASNRHLGHAALSWRDNLSTLDWWRPRGTVHVGGIAWTSETHDIHLDGVDFFGFSGEILGLDNEEIVGLDNLANRAFPLIFTDQCAPASLGS